MTTRRSYIQAILRLSASVVLVSAALLAPGAAHAETITATPPAGPIDGVAGTTMHSFLGIPYAVPPVGPLRWQPPQALAPWTTPRDGSTFGNRCAQTPSPFGEPSTSENCLFLNVYVPHRKHVAARDLRRRQPVMVWIHGGAFQKGSAENYDPTPLIAAGDVVVVTVNYRLGALGFLAHPALSAESPDGVSGNYGILDQQLALQWVHDNIAAFGGNPKKVTIFGESAGAISVHAQLASPGAAGLFHRAIAESGAIFSQPTLAAAETEGTAQADTLGCTDQTAACLRALSVEDILASEGTSLLSTTPVIDGVVLPIPMRQAFQTGVFNRVPVIEGSNHDEMRLFVALFFEIPNGPLTEAQYPDAVSALLGVPAAVVPVLTARYPTSNYPSPGLALSAMGTDAGFACNARAASRWFSLYVRSYSYEFADTNAPQRFLPPVSFPYGAYHASELQYLWTLPSPVPAPPLDPDQQQLSNTMVGYWTKFARTGKPSARHAARWTTADPADLSETGLMSLVPPAPVTKSPSAFRGDHKCGFWDPLVGN